MTKGRVMISDLKSRTLSLFRRSSASSTQSASSNHSAHGSDQQHQQHPSSTTSPIYLRKRPPSSRSRSSLVVPRLRQLVVDESSQQEAGKEREIGKPHLPSGTGPEPELQHRQPASQPKHHPQQHPEQPVSTPLPLPTPEPSPVHPPDANHELSDAPLLSVQPSTPEDPAQRTSQDSDESRTPKLEADEGDISTAAAQSSERPPRNLHLDLSSGRPRALSAGKRSLGDSRPRSPLHQSSLPGPVTIPADTASAAAIDNATKRPGQVGSRLSQEIEPADYFGTPPVSRHARTPPAMAHSPSRYPPQYFQAQQQQQQQPRRRKIWVKRPNASATMVAINEDDMVDDARDMILRKYANSLGRSFDSPDVTLRIHPREQPVSASQRSSSAQPTPSILLDERCLRPDEVLCRTIDVYFPGGQSVEEALIIDTPVSMTLHKARRTPRHSPGVHSTHFGIYGSQLEDFRPTESDKDYFPPTTVITQPQMSGASSPKMIGTLPVVSAHPHSIAVLNGGQLPPLPSPGHLAREGITVAPLPAEGGGGGGGGVGKRRPGEQRRPNFKRTHTSSPTIIQHADTRQVANVGQITQTPALSTPPHTSVSNGPRVATPPPRVASPRPKPRRGKKPSMSGSVSGLVSPQSSGLLASVPPINVLVVEDNIINLKLLEAFLKRLKVRSHSAKDGREAVAKWREGGFHLVLMDIQLPLMNGLEATKEIRRLERVNGVGAFVKTAEETKMESRQKRPEPASQEGSEETITKEDEEKEAERNRIGKKELFKSPVIIVALTASSLHSDRSEALAAGCNDFLTKPVSLTWLERKLKEWGCMQALIDFDGWRQWKDFQSPIPSVGPSPKVAQTPMKKSQLSITSTNASSAVFNSDATGPASAKGPSSRRSSGGAANMARPRFQSVALQDLAAQGESNNSTLTLDSVTSDDADSFDTTMPSRPEGHTASDTDDMLSPKSGLAFNVQAPTPRQSTDEAPDAVTASLLAQVPPSSAMRSPGDSGDEGERVMSMEHRRRKRSSAGQHARMLSAVGEETEPSQNSQGSQGGDEVEVGA